MSILYIAGYDGGPASLSAIGMTVALARAEGARVAVAHVHGEVPPLYVDVGVGVGVELHDELRRQGERLLAELDVPGIDEKLLLSGSPAVALQTLAEGREASLLAVGLTHREGVDRLIAGSVPAALLHGAPCPVLTVPPGAPAELPGTIAVAFDGGAEAHRALASATRLVAATGGELLVLGAFESPAVAASALGGGLDFERDVQAAFGDVVRQAATRIAGVPVRTRLLTGAPGSEIVEATREGVGLLVAGSRSRGPLRAVVLGSVSRHLVDHAACPVLIIPRSAEAEVDREPSP
jgi:nucleotide-binding universal stress UspA family protein